MIECGELTKRFGRLVAVDRLNLQVKSGELFGFLGPNGAGKTTTIRMLVGLLTPTAGWVRVGGIDMARRPLEAKALLGYVPDSPDLYERLTPRELLDLVAAIYRLDRAWARARARELLELFGIGEWADQVIGGLSRGTRQKLCLSAALLHQPKALFLDEPTVGLDPRGARTVKNLLRGLCRNGCAVFMSTHILEIAERMCDRVGIIHRGRLVAVGSLEEVRRAARGARVGPEGAEAAGRRVGCAARRVPVPVAGEAPGGRREAVA
ncbi:MAG: ABC transporter ATP-binding protein, partial [Acetobacteraceae bacterium]|nr:ABC transporter ATP-binding protein [Acetobacteraceae bacterium]